MSDYKTFSDAEVISLMSEGNSVAYTELYNRYYYLAFVFAFKKLRDEETAKDIVQELFVNIWEKRAGITRVNNFASYVFTAVRNRVFDIISHENVKSKYIESIVAHSITFENTKTDHLIREKQFREYIEQSIKQLPKKMREIFELSRKSDLTYSEIAEKLSISESTVNNQITNALNRLRTKLNSFFTFLLFL
ncbi:MAG: RNA polymerase sigma-70 factor [Flavobacterium sp.]|nr:MAG: RNA polymerase sigma-70 factor [Flavobacterium sp.]